MTVEVRDNGAPQRQRHGASAAQVDAAIRGVGLSSAFQPIVALPDGAVVGFEALARWPESTGLGPEVVFARAAALNRVDELDRLCIDTAIKGALAQGMTRNTLLCINCEPSSAMVDTVRNAVLKRGHTELQLMFELTERSLLAHPRALLAKVAVDAADAIGIPVTGIDLIVPSVEGDEYVFIEANERPGLANHEPRPTAQAFVDFLFPRTAATPWAWQPDPFEQH